MNKINVLFVCMGNICRSPTAEGVFIKLIEEKGITERFVVDSAGTHAYHVGDAPDLRAQRAARERDIDISCLRARRVSEADFEVFDYILAMDDDNMSLLSQMCPSHYQHKLRLFLDFALNAQIREVPDPYYGGPAGFERVLDLIEDASLGFLSYLQEVRKLPYMASV